MFKMNLFVTFICLLMLTTTLGIELELKPKSKEGMEECDNQKKVYLIGAESGMRFYTNENIDGTVNVTYDCFSPFPFEGIIRLDDKEHPKFIDTFLIKNCVNITLHLSSCNTVTKSVQVTGVRELRVITDRVKPPETVITDVKMLKWSAEFHHSNWNYYTYMGCHKTNRTLILKNVVVNHFDDYTIDSIYMTGVTVRSFTPPPITCSILSIKDSQFDYLERRSIVGEAKEVYIVNTTFEEVLSESFDLQANESFVFSGNHIKKIYNAIEITCPNVEIVGNKFDYGDNSAFKIRMLHPTFGKSVFTSLNVSLNKMNGFQDDLMWVDVEKYTPDFLVIENNYFDCTCRTSMFLKKLVNSTNIISDLFLDEDSNNFCENFENCPLRRLLGKESSVCKNTFVCPSNDVPKISAVASDEISPALKSVREI